MRFPTGRVLTLATGVAFEAQSIKEMIEIVLYLTRTETLILTKATYDNFHELCIIAETEIHRQFPWTATIDCAALNEQSVKSILKEMTKQYGAYLEVQPMKQMND